MDASKQTISPLRQRMVEDMRMRKFGEKTQLDYVRAVRNFTKYLGRSPDSSTVEDLRNYQLQLGHPKQSLLVTLTVLGRYTKKGDAVKHSAE